MTSERGYKKYCKYCYKEYWAKTYATKYCSDRCRTLDNQRKSKNTLRRKQINW